MRQKRVKKLRKEAIKFMKESGKRPSIANYLRSPWSNPYNNYIRQYRKGVYN